MGSWLIPLLLIGTVIGFNVRRRARQREFDSIVFGKLADYETPWLDVDLLRVLETLCDRVVAYTEMSRSVERLQDQGLASKEQRLDDTKCGRLHCWYFTATDRGRRIRKGVS